MSNVYSLPALEPPKQDDITAALKLIMALGDAKGTAATLKRLSEATAEHKAAASEAEEKLAEVERRETSLQSRLDAEDADLQRARSEHQRRLDIERKSFEEETSTREKKLAEHEKQVEEARARNVALHDDLSKRLALIKQASV